MKTVFLALFTALVAYVSYVFVHIGYFRPVEIYLETNPMEFQMIYKEHIGSYHKINETIIQVEEALKKINVKCLKSFGHYLDNPDIVDEARLRSHGGCILSSPVDLQNNSLQQKKMQLSQFIRSSFEGSPALGPIKVYPKVKEFAESKGVKISDSVLEVYTDTGKSLTTEFYFTLL